MSKNGRFNWDIKLKQFIIIFLGLVVLRFISDVFYGPLNGLVEEIPNNLFRGIIILLITIAFFIYWYLILGWLKKLECKNK